MWIYDRKSKILSLGDLKFANCYSGHGEGLDNPAMESVHDIGPLPSNLYKMTALIDSPHTGLATIILNSNTHPFGRDGFRIHGDNKESNFTASDGCIICGHAEDRLKIWNSNDHLLSVI